MFRLTLLADLSLFRLLTVFSRFPVCTAFQPFHKLMFHHQFTTADPQGWKIWVIQKVVRPRLGNLQCFGKLLCIYHIGHGFKRFSAHKILLSGIKKAATVIVTAFANHVAIFRFLMIQNQVMLFLRRTESLRDIRY